MKTSSRECKKSKREKLKVAGWVMEANLKKGSTWETRDHDQRRSAELWPLSWPRPHASMITTYHIWHVTTPH